MDRSAPHDRMHNIMAAVAAVIILASASSPVPEPPADAFVDVAAATGVEAALVDDGASGGRADEQLGGLNRAPVSRPAVHPRSP